MASKKTPVQAVEVETDDTAPKVLAQAIVKISDGMQKLLDGPLTNEAIVVLIHESVPVKDRPTKRDIKTVLAAVHGLAGKWVKPSRRSR